MAKQDMGDAESPGSEPRMTKTGAEPDQTAMLVPLEAIRPGRNARVGWENLGERLEPLMESIREQGILEPLLVREVRSRIPGAGPSSERIFELIAGFRRFAAAHRLNMVRVPVRVIAASDDEAMAVNLAENLAREDLTESDVLRAVEYLQTTYGWGVRKIARASGRSAGWISELLAVAGSPQERRAVETGKLALSAAFRLVRLRSASPELRDQLLARIDAGEIVQLDDVPRVKQIHAVASMVASASDGDEGPAAGNLSALPFPGNADVPVLDVGPQEIALVRNLRLVIRQVLATLHAVRAQQGEERQWPVNVRMDLDRAAEDLREFLAHERPRRQHTA